MKVFHITQFRCTFCTEWFDPYNPQRLPFALSCGHSICSTCLPVPTPDSPLRIICPEDLQLNTYKSSQHLPLNIPIRDTLSRILGQPSRPKESH